MKSWLLSLGSIALGGALLFATGCTKDPEQYTVIFRQNGEDDVVYTVDAGSDITELPTPKAVTGYTVNWDRTTIENVMENIVVTAVATANQYTITYTKEEGVTLDAYTQTVTYDAQYELKTPTKEGYSFGGWYNGTTLVEQSGVWKTASNVTLTAGWTENGGTEEPEQYTVTFRQEGYDDVVVTVDAGGDITVLPTPKAVTGYTVNWDRTTIENVTENIVVNAVPIANEYTITYAEDGTTQTVTYDAQYELKTPTKDLHTFGGWYNGTALVAQSGIWKNASDVTLTAEWSKNTYTVTFKQDGYDDVTVTVEAGSNIAELPTPKAVTGYTVNWDRTTIENVTENIVVNAVATPNQYTITYVLASDETMEGDLTQEVVFGSSYTLKVPTKEGGATLACWKTADGTKVEKTGAQWQIADNVTLTAVWKSDITVTFVYLDGTTVTVDAETGSELAAEKIPALTPVVGYDVSWSVTDWYLTGSMTVTEVREAKTYQITYQSADDVTNPTTNPTTITYGASYTLEDATHSDRNMIFAYWKNVETGERVASKGVWTIDGDVELVAVFVQANNPNDWTGNH